MQHMDESELTANHRSKLLNSSRSLYKKEVISLITSQRTRSFYQYCYFSNIQYRVNKTNILDVN